MAHAFTLEGLGNRNIEDFVILQIDFMNAFNSVNRTKFLELVKSDFPQIYHWVRFCYQGSPLLLFGKHQLFFFGRHATGRSFIPCTFFYSSQSLDYLDRTEMSRSYSKFMVLRRWCFNGRYSF